MPDAPRPLAGRLPVTVLSGLDLLLDQVAFANGRFDFDRASEGPGWLAALRGEESSEADPWPAWYEDASLVG